MHLTRQAYDDLIRHATEWVEVNFHRYDVTWHFWGCYVRNPDAELIDLARSILGPL
jgi:hypothetical protein